MPPSLAITVSNVSSETIQITAVNRKPLELASPDRIEAEMALELLLSTDWDVDARLRLCRLEELRLEDGRFLREDRLRRASTNWSSFEIASFWSLRDSCPAITFWLTLDMMGNVERSVIFSFLSIISRSDLA